jgi:2-keto-3-deoxy-L-rhamnonate aldolase RhmA
MIEDPAGVEAIDDIVAVDGLDALFVGRADLAVAYGDRDPSRPRVTEATRRVLAAAEGVGKPTCLLVSGAEEARALRQQGASAFILSSDQGFMRQAALAALRASRQRLQGAI